MQHFAALFSLWGASVTLVSGLQFTMDECPQPGADILFLIDTTTTLEDDLENIGAQLLNILDDLRGEWPETRFGVAEYKDKPLDPFGWEDDDYCYQVHSPITHDLDFVVKAFKGLYASGGRDLKEGSFTALYNAVNDIELDWSTERVRFVGDKSGKDSDLPEPKLPVRVM